MDTEVAVRCDPIHANQELFNPQGRALDGHIAFIGLFFLFGGIVNLLHTQAATKLNAAFLRRLGFPESTIAFWCNERLYRVAGWLALVVGVGMMIGCLLSSFA